MLQPEVDFLTLGCDWNRIGKPNTQREVTSSTVSHERKSSHAQQFMIVLGDHETCPLFLAFAICCRPSVCLSFVTLVHPTQAVVNVDNFSTVFGTFAIH